MFKFVYKTLFRCFLFGMLFSTIFLILSAFLCAYFRIQNTSFLTELGFFSGYGFTTLLIIKNLKI